MNIVDVDKILKMGIMLSSEHDFDTLLSKIIDTAMEITNCDGGTLYLADKNGNLSFRVMKTISMGINEYHEEKEKLPPVPVMENKVSGYCAIHRKMLNIADVRTCKEFDFEGPKEYDAMTGYSTISMLVFPMVNHEERLIGVVQLINAQNKENKIIPFPEDNNLIIESLGSQAAVAVSNMQYTKEIENLMRSVTRVFADAIDTKMPYNYYHSRNVCCYIKEYIKYTNEKYGQNQSDRKFTKEEADELEMAALLHDIGKLTIPNDVINKETRLEGKEQDICSRMDYIESLYHIDYLENHMDESNWKKKQREIQNIKKRIVEINTKGVLEDEDVAFGKCLATKYYRMPDGRRFPYITQEEAECLQVRKGTLTEKERQIVNSHVNFTEEYLQKMKFENRYPHIELWAGAHHELMNGMGYPNGLKGDEIPYEARLLAIVDKYEAMTSQDRPYKPAMSNEKALGILNKMAEHGEVDSQILQKFGQMMEERGNKIQLYRRSKND